GVQVPNVALDEPGSWSCASTSMGGSGVRDLHSNCGRAWLITWSLSRRDDGLFDVHLPSAELGVMVRFITTCTHAGGPAFPDHGRWYAFLSLFSAVEDLWVLPFCFG